MQSKPLLVITLLIILIFLLHAADSFLRSQLVLKLVKKFPHFWNPNVHHHTHRCPPPVPILNQLRPVPTTPSHILKIHFNIILPSTSGSPQLSLSLSFPHQNPVHPSSLHHKRHMPRHLILLDFTTLTILGTEYRSLSSSLCNFPHSPVISSLLRHQYEENQQPCHRVL